MSRAVFYNAAPPGQGRSARELSRELTALARAYRPRVIGVCEAIGYGELLVPGYAQVRDRSKAGRANLVAYVREDCTLRRTWWTDCRETWTRTERPGTHPARSILVMGIGTLQVVVAHQAPKGTDNTYAAQLEGVRRRERIMAPWKDPDSVLAREPRDMTASKDRPRLALADWNRTRGERGPGPSYLASAIDGKVYGGRIDAAVARRLPEPRAEYVTRADGVELGTDHRHGALVLHIGKAEGLIW